jgi:spermidine/putrescine-binding protein
MAKDTSWHRFFDPEKSPHTFWNFNPVDKRIEFGYVAKHTKRMNRTGRLVWISANKNTYGRSIHGELIKKGQK